MGNRNTIAVSAGILCVLIDMLVWEIWKVDIGVGTYFLTIGVMGVILFIYDRPKCQKCEKKVFPAWVLFYTSKNSKFCPECDEEGNVSKVKGINLTILIAVPLYVTYALIRYFIK